MSNVLQKWNEMYGTKQLLSEIAKVQQGNNGEYKNIPDGNYEVKVDKIDIKECKSDKHFGEPMLNIQFRILEGEYKGSCIFYNKLLTQAYSIHSANELLRSFDSDIEVDFDGNYSHYKDMLDLIKNNIDKYKLEYLLTYTTDKNGYKDYFIEEVYDTVEEQNTSNTQFVDDDDLPY